MILIARAKGFVVWVIVYGRIQDKNVLRPEFCCCSWDRFSIPVWFAAMTRKNCSTLKPRKFACYNSGMSSIDQTKEEESEPKLQHSNCSLRSNTRRRVIFLFPRSARYSPDVLCDVFCWALFELFLPDRNYSSVHDQDNPKAREA